MVPKRVGEDLRRRRLQLNLKQQDVADVIHTTRAYVSAVENGVDWDPDTDKLTAWSRLLGWDDDAILRRLNRMPGPAGEAAALSPEVVNAITMAVQAGIRDGMEEVLRLIREDEPGTIIATTASGDGPRRGRES